MHATSSFKALVPAFLLLTETALGAGLDCKHARDDGMSWNFGPLKGRHSVSWAHEQSSHAQIHNTTFLIDICGTLDKGDDMQCLTGTHICAMDQDIDDDGKKISKPDFTDIAGEYTLNTGGKLDNEWQRLKNSDSNSDSGKHGVRLKMGGGKAGDGQKQQALIEFLCIKKEERRADGDIEKRVAKDEEGDEEGDEDEDEGDGDGDGDGDDKGGDGDHHSGGSHDNLDETHPDWAKLRETDDGKGGSIKFLTYKVEGSHKVLRLQWKTPYACEGADSDEDLHDPESSGGWGFFSWFFFLAFMGILAYFAFFAWINYSRHGATGWDMLPHADTIRDIPYILGDWGRKVVGTVQGGSSRGGYSAL